ncbi:hypothetical protein [Candidatus Symbiopectobacterium sp. 'North America']|uniref:hypothetical protein n=1 Tax=Candidatus Symbiopectobacterium sp. 'North America' TaxID=2794574 RepID=UPI00245442A6|nr:hypothetical protein [Candidatus Symbiopectobacterium sp. 'North America']
MAAVLGVSTMAYMPFAIFNIAAPLITLALGITGINIKPILVTAANSTQANSD